MAPEGGRILPSSQHPSGPRTRPWILRFARTPDPATATPVPAAFYDHVEQISLSLHGALLPYMGTHKATVPDGDVVSPPPLDEGEKD